LEADYQALGSQLQRRGISIDAAVEDVRRFSVALPSWGVGTGGTRFARYPGDGEPRTVFEKVVDCATVHALTRCAPRISLHIPWDKPRDVDELVEHAAAMGLGFDAMNSNTFQDQQGQALSYKFGSLTHTDPEVRRQAVEHNIECIRIGEALGSRALTVWIGDGGNFPGQVDFRRSLDRYLDSLKQIYAAVPEGWRLFVEYKLYEPAFYSTVINDWGTAYTVARQLGPKAFCLVDLGHHAPNVNIEMIVSRLIQLEKLGGFHFNDSKYGDDDLDTGSIKPYQLFLIFTELVAAASDPDVKNFTPSYMIDQSHNVTDPIESLISSIDEIQRAYARALLISRPLLAEYQEKNDAIMSTRILKEAFNTDVTPMIEMARTRSGGAIDPIGVYRESGYRSRKFSERPSVATAGAGIV
ncbi:MAG: L-rhamnose catabolism isomerase, partial [Ignavibacteria bacterium]|nr:L-rhamnose catabolism isomerase [Ignavibacteria bacterium]